MIELTVVNRVDVCILWQKGGGGGICGSYSRAAYTPVQHIIGCGDKRD